MTDPGGVLRYLNWPSVRGIPRLRSWGFEATENVRRQATGSGIVGRGRPLAAVDLEAIFLGIRDKTPLICVAPMPGALTREIETRLLATIRSQDGRPWHLEVLLFQVGEHLWSGQALPPRGAKEQVRRALATLSSKGLVVRVRADGQPANPGERTSYWSSRSRAARPSPISQARERAAKLELDRHTREVVEGALFTLGEFYGRSADDILGEKIRNPRYEGLAFGFPPADLWITIRDFLEARRAQLCRICCIGKSPKPWATATASVGSQSLMPIASDLLVEGWTVELARIALVGLSVWGISRFCQSCGDRSGPVSVPASPAMARGHETAP